MKRSEFKKLKKAGHLKGQRHSKNTVFNMGHRVVRKRSVFNDVNYQRQRVRHYNFSKGIGIYVPKAK